MYDVTTVRAFTLAKPSGVCYFEKFILAARLCEVSKYRSPYSGEIFMIG